MQFCVLSEGGIRMGGGVSSVLTHAVEQPAHGAVAATDENLELLNVLEELQATTHSNEGG